MHLHKLDSLYDLFKENRYIFLKNYLYYYLLRKRSIKNIFRHEDAELILEIGGGISPVIALSDRIIYSDLSLAALQTLKQSRKNGFFVVADGMNLPFRTAIFSHAISSEVIEHILDDDKALKELARIMKKTGHLILTFPHKKFYFSFDDRFLGHFRRYELDEIKDKLKKTDLKIVYQKKVLGPLDKLTMLLLVYFYSFIQCYLLEKSAIKIKPLKLNIIGFLFKWINRFYIFPVWLDALIMPFSLSSVVLIKAQKH